MALTCPIDLDTARLRAEIQAVYRRVASSPDGDFHFHRGPEYAVHYLGYDPAELNRLPPDVSASFAGVGNPHAVAPLRRGASVVDVGCGAGTDLLIAARAVGPDGRAIGVDMTDEMLGRARAGARTCGLDHVECRIGDATGLPLEDEEVDIVISNGVLNLVPDKGAAIREIRRVLRPGGRVQIADITIGVERPIARSETSICGPVESPVLCRRQSSLRRSKRLGSATCASPVISTASLERRRNGRRASTRLSG